MANRHVLFVFWFSLLVLGKKLGGERSGFEAFGLMSLCCSASLQMTLFVNLCLKMEAWKHPYADFCT